MNEARASASPRPSPQGGAGQQETARWACTVCRARKVKCDRILPNCTGCSNNPEGCRYETARKRAPRRSTYKDIVERLAKMESVTKEFSKSKASTPPSNHFDPGPDPNTIPNVKRTSLGPSSKLVFEEDGFINASAIPMSEDSQSAQAGFEPHLNHNAATLVVDNDLEVEYTGLSCIFSLQGIRWVNDLVGDDCFGRSLSTLTLTPPPRNRGNVALSSIHPLPSKSETIDYANDYLAVVNRDMRLFDDQEILDGIERYYSTGISPSRSWFVAVNVIIGLVLRKHGGIENSVESEKYIGNAMSMIPSILMSKPNPLNAGAMLSMTVYFMLVSDNQTAIMILGAAIQLMVLGGYYTPRMRPSQTDQEKLRERRLFWQAFVLDHDLALQVGKPPMIGPDFVIDLPDALPEDGVGTMTFDNSTTLNILREQVKLTRIKSKVYSLLYAKDVFKSRDHEDIKVISDLDSELYAWKACIPEITKSDRPDHDDKNPGLMCLTILHYTYYQLIIVIHSFIFQSSNLVESEENFERALSSIALCVGAARATISLLDFHEDRHPFSIHLLNNVSWSLDIIFINILQNKGTTSAQEDLTLLRRVISLFKKYDPNYIRAASFRIANIFYQVAWKALQNYAFYQTPPPNYVLPPIAFPISKAWNRYIQIPDDTSASKPLESNQVPFYDRTTGTQSTFPSDQPVTIPFNLPTHEQFHGLRLDDNPIPTSSNMVWTGQDQGGLNTGWRQFSSLDSPYWQDLWTTATLPDEEWLQYE